MRTAAIIVVATLVIAAVALLTRAKAVTYTSTAGAAQWSADNYTDYECPQTLMSGWCVLPSESAGVAQCSADPACAGYLVPGPVSVSHTGLSGLANTSGIVQLYTKPLAPAAWATDTTVMSKNST